MARLETVDLTGVEILEADVRVHGIGSPPEGDVFTKDNLRAMAQAAAELADEIAPPSKIGHSKSSDPAVGWLDNIRVNDDGSKLLADVKNVPKTFSELLDVGAYRNRSVELRKYTSQKTEKTYDWVVSGLAWLGGKLPAVKTLDDVVKLYSGDDSQIRFVAMFEEGAVAWDSSEGFEAIRSRVRAALNPGPGIGESRYWVRDIASGKALVQEGYDDSAPGWVVPYTIDGDVVTIADSSEWVEAEQAWVETAKSFGESTIARLFPGEMVLTPAQSDRLIRAFAGKNDGPPDGRGVPVKFTDEQRRSFAEATGLEADKVTDEMLAAAGVAELKPAGDEVVTPEPNRELEERVVAAEKLAADTAEELRTERKRNFVDGLVKTGKIEPGNTETWEKRYDRDPELAREFAEDLKPDPALVAELGAEGDGTTPAAGSGDPETDSAAAMKLYEEANEPREAGALI